MAIRLFFELWSSRDRMVCSGYEVAASDTDVYGGEKQIHMQFSVLVTEMPS